MPQGSSKEGEHLQHSLGRTMPERLFKWDWDMEEREEEPRDGQGILAILMLYFL